MKTVESAEGALPWKVTVLRSEQPEKAPEPIEMTLGGTVIWVSCVQPVKALAEIVVHEEGMEIEITLSLIHI